MYAYFFILIWLLQTAGFSTFFSQNTVDFFFNVRRKSNFFLTLPDCGKQINQNMKKQYAYDFVCKKNYWLFLNNSYNLLINTLATTKMKSTSTWKRHQFCGGSEVFGTKCYIDEISEVVYCTCTKQDNLRGWCIKKRLTWWIVTLKTRIIVHKNKSGKILLINSMQPWDMRQKQKISCFKH